MNDEQQEGMEEGDAGRLPFHVFGKMTVEEVRAAVGRRKMETVERLPSGAVGYFHFSPSVWWPTERVVGLRFQRRDRELADILKASIKRAALIARAQEQRDRTVSAWHGGGWLPELKSWYVRLPTWPAVRADLEAVLGPDLLVRIVRPADIENFGLDEADDRPGNVVQLAER